MHSRITFKSFLAGALAASAGAAAQTYTMTDLGVLPGGSESAGLAINDHGDVAGTYQSSTATRATRAVRYSGGLAEDLGLVDPLNGWYSRATAINNSGVVAGFGNLLDAGLAMMDHGFIDAGEGMIDLDPINLNETQPMDVNESGTVVGMTSIDELIDGTNVHHAFAWNGGGFLDLGTLGGPFSIAMGVNDSGVIVGSSLTASGPLHAFAYAGSMTDLGTLGGAASEAHDVSNAGVVVGWAQDAGGRRRAFRHAGGAMQALGALSGAASSEAYAVNESGQVVGSSWVAGQGPRAFIHEQGQMKDLGSLVGGKGWVLKAAWDINESGQIVGHGMHNGELRGFILTPIRCFADFDGSGTLDLFDFLGYVNAFNQGDPRADCNTDGTLDLFDFLCFVNAFNQAC
jgi:probable HAF family extracellular repeat protein